MLSVLPVKLGKDGSFAKSGPKLKNIYMLKGTPVLMDLGYVAFILFDFHLYRIQPPSGEITMIATLVE
jgi:hypothetical protein